MTTAIGFLFNLLFFLVPLTFYHKTSELFEFNKINLVYLFTVLIIVAWIYRMLQDKKTIFRPTPMDLPLVLFLLTQSLATIFSIDRITSLFGYYNRFNGGLISLFSFALLYWAFVSNLNSKQAKNIIRVSLVSGVIISIWALLEHFGYSISCLLISAKFNNSCWVQDVSNRVFATFGQPNWLAAYIVVLIPFSWAFHHKTNSKYKFIYLVLSALFFSVLLFTKSRSGFVSFIIVDILFWLISWLKNQTQSRQTLVKSLLVFNLLFLVLTLSIGSPFNTSNSSLNNQVSAPLSGGTESGEIRKIVWQGAIELWRRYPILGTGVETFAYSYYLTRPQEHNLTTEWDFLYNKAHNEFLNYLANTGSLGLLAYLTVILIFIRKLLTTSKTTSFDLAILASFVSIQITNFFGFSVVTINLFFFLIPAIWFTIKSKGPTYKKLKISPIFQTLSLVVLTLLTTLFIVAIWRYWSSDILYAKGKEENQHANYTQAADLMLRAIRLNPLQAQFYDQLAFAYSQIGLDLWQKNQKELADKFIKFSEFESLKVYSLVPRNVNLLKAQANIFFDLSQVEPNYLEQSIKTLLYLTSIAPTDASIYYRLGLVFSSIDLDKAKENLQKAVELKADYKKARIALALVYKSQNNLEDAINQYEYILSNISPNDELVKSSLESIKD